MTFLSGGCASDTPLNPSFPLTQSVARAALDQMQASPKSLSRPVVVLGGFHDPGIVASHIADEIRNTVSDRTQVIDISFFETRSFDACADKLIRKIDERFPSDNQSETVEVDVVAFSMGGLVARHAASAAYASAHQRRLRMVRLFTISTPHQGANLASLPTLDDRVKDMREGSAFLVQLNGDDAVDEPVEQSESVMIVNREEGSPRDGYRLFAYVRLEDGVIGEEHAAPPGVHAWWVPTGWTFSHLFAGFDDRILADVLRRLRDEEPYSIEPPAPLPP
jgi:hypothetical protein